MNCSNKNKRKQKKFVGLQNTLKKEKEYEFD